jgi:hypothetical protein
MGGRCAAAETKSGCWRRPGPQRGSPRSAEREWIRNGRSSEIEPKPGAIGTAAAGYGSPSGRGKRRTGNRFERGQAAGTGQRTNRLSAGLVSHQTKELSFWTITVPTERIGFPVLLKANLLIQMVHEGSKRMNLFQYSGPSCGAQSASGSKVLPLILGPAETLAPRVSWPSPRSAVRVFNTLAASETWNRPRRRVFYGSGRKPKRQSGGDLPDRGLSGRAIGLIRSPVAGSPVLRGLKHRVVAAPETLSTAYRAEQQEPQKVSLEKIAGARAVALKAATVLTSKLTGSHI